MLPTRGTLPSARSRHVGSGATGAREPSQVRKEAALSGSAWVPPGRLTCAASGPLSFTGPADLRRFMRLRPPALDRPCDSTSPSGPADLRLCSCGCDLRPSIARATPRHRPGLRICAVFMRLRPPALDRPCDSTSPTGPADLRRVHAAATSGPRSPVRLHVTDRACGSASSIARFRRGARAAESARLESVCGATHRGFESHSLRHFDRESLTSITSLGQPAPPWIVFSGPSSGRSGAGRLEVRERRTGRSAARSLG